jgi:hypothetical protein
MYLVSRFRRATLWSEPFTRVVFAGGMSVANRPAGYRPAPPRQEKHNCPQLTCEWEESEEPFVQIGDQTFRAGDIFMHWMPVH